MNYLEEDIFRLGDQSFHSRLFLGTGKFSSPDSMLQALEASGSQMVTLALKRVDLNPASQESDEGLYAALKQKNVVLLPNTSGAATASEAIRLAHLARSMGAGNWLKLEIHPNPRHLMPDPIETLTAAIELVKEGFHVLPYINADPVLAKRLEDAGCAAVMPLGSPIGSHKGLQTKGNLEIILAESNVPVIVDAGLGMPSHAAEAMEMGASAVLVNTAIAVNRHPAAIAHAFRLAVDAGRLAWLHKKTVSGTEGQWASASSPLTAFLDEA